MNPKTHPKKYRQLKNGERLQAGDLYETCTGFDKTNGHNNNYKVGDDGYTLIYYRLTKTNMKKQPKIIEVGDYLVYKKGRQYVVTGKSYYSEKTDDSIRYGDDDFDVYQALEETSFTEKQAKSLLPLLNIPATLGGYELNVNMEDGFISVGCTDIDEDDLKAVLKL